jgi:hypothetical protein
MSKALKDFLLDLVLAVVPLILGGLTYSILDINTLKSETAHLKDQLNSTMGSIDRRLNRIEDKIDERLK